MSTGSSSDPALIVTVFEGGSDSCQSRAPQFGQKAQWIRRPLSVARLQNFGAPCVTRSPALGTLSDVPNSEADCFWHSRQWHT